MKKQTSPEFMGCFEIALILLVLVLMAAVCTKAVVANEVPAPPNCVRCLVWQINEDAIIGVEPDPMPHFNTFYMPCGPNLEFICQSR